MFYIIIKIFYLVEQVGFSDVAIDAVEVPVDVIIVRKVVPCRVHHRLSLSYRGSC